MRNPLTPITPPRRMHSMVAAKIALADMVAMRFPEKDCTTQLLHVTQNCPVAYLPDTDWDDN